MRMVFITVFIIWIFVLANNIIVCVNLTHMIGIYESICGGMVCNSKFLITPQNNVSVNERCQICSCDENCFHNRNCCPDVFLGMNFTCVKTNIFRANKTRGNDVEFSTAMVTTCPWDSDEDEKQKCENVNENFVSKFQNAPVYSIRTGKTYRNIHCFECHNESASDSQFWGIEILCEKFSDFNFLSSFDEIISQAEESHCNISYKRPNDDYITWNDVCNGKPSKYEDQNLIYECNKTGTWETYDPDIDFYCKLYDNRYQRFKNVFCAICNPSKYSGIKVTMCNDTGNWKHFDSNIKHGCESELQTIITAPFKNFYCFICNINHKTKRNIGTFNEMDTDVESFPLGDTLQEGYLIKSRYLDIGEIINSGREFLMEHIDENLKIKTTSHKDIYANVNVPNLASLYFASTGRSKFSKNYFFTFENESCNHDDSCFFSKEGCCIEKYFEKSLSCTKPRLPDVSYSYLVIDSCPKTLKPSIVHDLCFLQLDDFYFSTQPFKAKMMPFGFAQYKNIFCALCNGNIGPNSTILDLKVKCNRHVPPFYFLSFNDYLLFVRENNCGLQYTKPSNAVPCYENKRHCNETGLWKSFDKDVKKACENVPDASVSKIFCDLCNPLQSDKILLTKCNETGEWEDNDKQVDGYCLNLPVITSMAPYKNFFCKQCNRSKPRKPPPCICNGERIELTEEVDRKTDWTLIPETSPIPRFDLDLISYRSIFAFSNYKNDETKPVSTECATNEVFIKGKCLKEACNPGRMLVDGRCSPLLQFTSNLGYKLSTSLKTKLEVQVNDTGYFHELVLLKYSNLLQERLRVDSTFILEQSILISNVPCNSPMLEGTEVSMDLYFKIFIPQIVHRTFIEDELINIINTELHLEFDHVNHTMKATPENASKNIPEMLSKFRFTDKCMFKDTKYERIVDLYFHSSVNKLLTCEQIELSIDEFKLDYASLDLTIVSEGITIPSEYYILVESNNARICIDIFQTLVSQNISQENPVNIWVLITIICMGISLVCLFITFVTYCLFQSLRTLPGINNMCLVFAMFCSNFTFMFIISGSRTVVGCHVVGITIHYFWLCTFTCLNVCSFHMYRVFTSKTGLHIATKAALIRYLTYSFGVPAIIVSLNIAITKGVTRHSIGYGSNMCFLTQQVAFFVTFIAPIGTICLLNIYFFVLTAVTIARRPTVNSDSQVTADKLHLFVYIKLFAITGISWAFQLVDAFLPESAFSTFTAILNALQGLFIFVSYICNKRVVNLYRRCSLLSRDRSNSMEPSRRTALTDLSSSKR